MENIVKNVGLCFFLVYILGVAIQLFVTWRSGKRKPDQFDFISKKKE